MLAAATAASRPAPPSPWIASGPLPSPPETASATWTLPAGACVNDADSMHARFYNPQLGRFLSVDPALAVRRSMRSPQGWNRYSYALNGPLKYVDPSGMIFVLSGCAAGGSAKSCNQQKSVLQQAFGDNYSFLTVNEDGTVSLKVSGAAFGGLGTLEAGFGALVASDKTFRLITGPSREAARGGGAATVVRSDFLGRSTGADIHMNLSGLPASAGGTTQTAATVFAHEVGHAASQLFPGAADAVNTMTMGPVLYKGEGYPMTFENRYRSERGLSPRPFYLREGDYSPFAPPWMNLFTP